jgi:hypothetical protein
MKTALLILIILLTAGFCFAQAVSIPFVVTDGSNSDTLRLGLDPTATDGIDAHLGEAELPPSPPTGVFDARLFGEAIGQGVKRDYRQGWPPHNIFRTYKIKYQAGSASPLYRLLFSGFPPFPIGVSIRIQDNITGTLIDTTLRSAGNYTVQFQALQDLKLTVEFILLPVELNSFTANITQNDVNLTWTTSTETNNRGFEVHRKNESSEEWQTIGFVNGSVNSNSIREYNFTDRSVNAGSYNYRLKQIDLNGNFEYYLLNEVINIGRPNSFQLLQNYPNPFNPATTISFQLAEAGIARLVIYDSDGKLVRELINEFKPAGIYQHDLDASEMSSGVYFYTLESGMNFQTKSMILLK